MEGEVWNSFGNSGRNFGRRTRHNPLWTIRLKNMIAPPGPRNATNACITISVPIHRLPTVSMPSKKAVSH